MRQTRRALVLVASVGLWVALSSQAQELDAPNFIPISPDLATSGQPSEDALRALAGHGFRAVVYLAPSDVQNAVPRESELLAAQGVDFIHIPIPFGAPDSTHVAALFAALNGLRGRKTLVHCEINMRASTMVFLYRTIQLREDPSVAYESVTRIWSPRGPWRRLVTQELAKNGIKFEAL